MLEVLVVFLASTVMTMAGLGAAGFYVPLFFWMGVPLREALPTALFLNVIALSLATVNYVRYGLVDFRVGLPIVAAAMLFAPLGALTAQYFDRNLILILFVCFLILSAASMLFYRPGAPARQGRKHTSFTAAAQAGGESVLSASARAGGDSALSAAPRAGAGSAPAPTAEPAAAAGVGDKETAPVLSRRARLAGGSGIGALTGYVAGLLAIGGGVVVIPFLNYFRYPIKTAVATTGLVAFCASLSGFLGHVVFGEINQSLLLPTGAAAAAGALFASWLVRYRISGPRLKTLIGVLMLLIAARLIYDLLR